MTPPSPSTLRYWQTGVNNLHQESFQVLKEICEDSSPKVDSNAVTLLYLTRKEFAGYSPVKQALCLHLLTRHVKLLAIVVTFAVSEKMPPMCC